MRRAGLAPVNFKRRRGSFQDPPVLRNDSSWNEQQEIAWIRSTRIFDLSVKFSKGCAGKTLGDVDHFLAVVSPADKLDGEKGRR